MVYAYSFEQFAGRLAFDSSECATEISLTEQYARTHGLTLHERTCAPISDVLKKRSLSIELDALQAFVQSVQSGVIPRGAYLLIEDFDWLSLKFLSAATSYFSSLLQLDFKIVTLQDANIYSLKGLTPYEASVLHTNLQNRLMNEISSKRSRESKKRWEEKRKSDDVLTAKGPSWMRFNRATGKWDLIPEKVEVVRQIFRWAHAGYGQEKIAAMLRDKGTPMMSGKMTEWQQSSVRNLLLNQAVIGNYVPKTGGNGIRANCYPPIIDKEIFHTIQADIGLRANGGGLGKANKVPNLFLSISYCLYCGERMRYDKDRKGNAYLQCRSPPSGGNACNAARFPYVEAEAAILDRLIQAQGSDLQNEYRENDDTRQQLLKGEIAALKKRQDHAYAISQRIKSISIDAVAKELDEIQMKIDALEKNLMALDSTTVTVEEVRESLSLIFDLNRTTDPVRLSALRLNIRTALVRLVKKIEFAPMWTSSKVGRDYAYKHPDFFDGKLMSKTGARYPLSEEKEMLIQLSFKKAVRIVDASGFVSHATLKHLQELQVRRERRATGI